MPASDASSDLGGLDAWREGLFAAALVVFVVLFQFSQTLWRLDVWAMLGLCLAASQLRPASSRAASGEADPPVHLA